MRLPVYNTHARIVGEQGEELAPGQIGELAIAGPQIIPAYWNKPEQTAAALPGGELRTGDGAFMDADGWFFIADRKKDMISEAEDMLYRHPAVREAAVLGVSAAYRGETVKACVVSHPGVDTSAQELIAFCKSQMAAYKYPRQWEFRRELPETASGKILRRHLCDT